jgi:exopolyphosphatase/guanosine-5'-triphosphate,3'-diphosphate pyrophosphatase
MRSAVIDLGSKTFHLLVADADHHGIRNVIRDHKIAVRIGEHAFAEGSIPNKAFTRGLVAADKLIDRAGLRAEQIRVVATGVFREATNGPLFLSTAAQRTGVAIELLDGNEEARLTWLAVSVELAGTHGRLAVIDLGGGTLDCGFGASTMASGRSLPLGVLRLRGLAPDDVRKTVVTTASDTMRELRDADPDTVAISSGTARALLRLARRLRLVAPEQRYIWRGTLGELARTLATLPEAAIAALGVEPARVDTIATGAVVLHTVLEQLGRPVVYVARSALREGALIDLARRARHERTSSSMRERITGAAGST